MKKLNKLLEFFMFELLVINKEKVDSVKSTISKPINWIGEMKIPLGLLLLSLTVFVLVVNQGSAEASTNERTVEDVLRDRIEVLNQDKLDLREEMKKLTNMYEEEHKKDKARHQEYIDSYKESIEEYKAMIRKTHEDYSGLIDSINAKHNKETSELKAKIKELTVVKVKPKEVNAANDDFFDEMEEAYN